MRDRDLLSDKLHEIRANVYFQPGPNTSMKYPCLAYEFEGPRDVKADNGNFITLGKYSIKDIYKNPSSRKFDEIRKLDYCSWNTSFITDGLYHDVYVIYF